MDAWETLRYIGLGSIGQIAYHPDGVQLAVASSIGVVIWDTEKGEATQVLVGHTDPVSSVAWSPDGSQIASGSADRTVRVWDVRTGALLRTLIGHTARVNSVAWSPDGAKIASAGHARVYCCGFRCSQTCRENGTMIRIWSAQTGDILRNFRAHNGLIESLAWSPDSAQLASGSTDRTIKVWEADSGTLIHTLAGHTGYVSSVVWSSDGSWIASGSSERENAIKVWEAASGVLLRTLTGHTGWVTSVAWSPEACQLASGSADGSVRIWGRRP